MCANFGHGVNCLFTRQYLDRGLTTVRKHLSILYGRLTTVVRNRNRVHIIVYIQVIHNHLTWIIPYGPGQHMWAFNLSCDIYTAFKMVANIGHDKINYTV